METIGKGRGTQNEESTKVMGFKPIQYLHREKKNDCTFFKCYYNNECLSTYFFHLNDFVFFLFLFFLYLSMSITPYSQNNANRKYFDPKKKKTC